ncbi:asparate kinase, monofunctional class [beta proteobacterium KB13]|uniref:Aspartokinase n=1 Tax=beta proteobacterium KB13 TaxID=314607 RepID=B6BWK1_9PROT|nr:asparate kinase, monofunctional class [beta proteobacterium KB13]
MSLIVQKYGGTSVANPERINAVADRVKGFVDDGHQVVVVVSAMSGETNKLLQLIKDVSKQPSPRESDVIVSTGEQVTIGLTALAIQERGIKAKSYTGSQVKILTDNAHSKARIINIGTENIQKDLADGYVLVIAGFQGADENGNITTLGRGGSDTTAVAIAAALKADECQIYTDVNGIYTTDPRVVSTARKLKSITFEEMLELASLGSKVLQIRSVEFAGKYKVKLRVLSSFEKNGDGTIITYEEDHKMEDPIISGIAFNRDEAKVTVQGIPDTPGLAYQILGPIAEQNIDVDMIIQNIGHDGENDFTFTVNKSELDKTLEILEGMKSHLNAKKIIGDPNIAKLSLVGVGMKSHVGVASKMFRTLSEEGINISTISTSEIKISILIDENLLDMAVQSLHKAFNLDQ